MKTGDASLSCWPKRATVLVMCFLATFVLFLDRVNMSVAVIAMQKEFGWSESTKGLGSGLTTATR